VRRRRVLVVTPDSLTDRMAGPAIRSWHVAADLAAEHDVTLLSTNTCTMEAAEFSALAATSQAQVAQLAAAAEIMIVQGDVLDRYPVLARSELPMVVDLYDPFLFEQLEQTLGLEAETRWAVLENARRVLVESLVRGDIFLCASEKQRDLWIGHLAAVGRVNQVSYDDDPTLRQLVRVVPFGIPDQPPLQRRHRIKGALPGVAADDLVVLWGGGVYDWLDPITVIEAIDVLRERVPKVRLVFLGMRHPHPDVPEMEVAKRARRLARELGLEGRFVHFTEGWVPYHARADWLLDADVAVTAHRDHVESTYAFRTRILDCLWAGIPAVATTGDTLAELIDSYGLGQTVPPGDAGATAAALERLLVDSGARQAARAALAALAPTITWHAALTPLRAFCAEPRRAPDRLDRPIRRRLARQQRATIARSGPGRDVAVLRDYLDRGGVALVARKVAAGVRRRLSRHLRPLSTFRRGPSATRT
jgi:glycosyltransferase involved in cell wall biosynthesis